jgi:putative FmdB family regulatory protein
MTRIERNQAGLARFRIDPLPKAWQAGRKEYNNDAMPIFEYACESCGHHFEHLTRADHEATCPACQSGHLNKQLSTFAVGANGASARTDFAAPGACGACGDPRGPGACSMN